MTVSRRSVVAGLGIAASALPLGVPSIVRADQTARRAFRIVRDGSDIGSHTIALSRSGSEIQAAIDIDIRVKVLGLTVYRYEMSNRETWRDGRLTGLETVVNNDGDAEYARAGLVAGRLIVDGSGYQGEAPLDAATTSYWSYDFLRRGTWISTQSGALQTVKCAPRGAGTVQTGQGQIAGEAWAVTGDFEVDLFYVKRDWAGVTFDAGGEQAVYVPDRVNAALQPVWDAAT